MHLPEPETRTFQPCPAGTHLAICFQFIDLGTQKYLHPTGIKEQRKVLISWELPELKLAQGGAAGKPFCFHQQYTWSMHEKATLRKHLESWRGVPFTRSDFGKDGCDARDLLGKPCNLVLVPAGSGSPAKLQTIRRMVRGAPHPGNPSNSLIYFSLDPDRFDYLTFLKLGVHWQEAVRKSPEFQRAIHLDARLNTSASSPHRSAYAPTADGPTWRISGGQGFRA